MKTFVGNLFAVSTLTAFIATSVPSAAAVALSPAPHVARHLMHAHGVKPKRNLHKRSCQFRTPSADPSNSGDSTTNNGGSTDNSGGNTDNSGTTDTNGGSTDNNAGGSYNDGGSTDNNGGSTDNSGGNTDNGGSATDNSGSTTDSSGSTTGNSGSTDSNSGDGGYGGSSGGNSGGSSGANTSSGLTGKKGLAFPMGCSDLEKWHPWSDIKWHYNWRPTPYGDCPSDLPPFIPMLWGWGYEDAFEDAVRDQAPHTALFLNEPDMGGDLSSGISPSDAVGLWNKHMEPLRQRGTRVGSAATTSAPYGKQWQQEFEAGCNCKPDFYAIHYYDVTPQGFIDYATDWHNTFGGNIWVTEMACQNFNGGDQCTSDQIYNFISTISHWCETTDWIEAYTFFGAMSDVQNVNPMDKMMTDDGTNGPDDLGFFMLAAY